MRLVLLLIRLVGGPLTRLLLVVLVLVLIRLTLPDTIASPAVADVLRMVAPSIRIFSPPKSARPSRPVDR